METKNMDTHNSTFDKYNELIINYLNSSLPEEDEIILREWISQSEANKRYFDEFREVWLSAKLKNALNEFDSKAAFRRFKSNIGEEEEYEASNGLFLKRITLSLGKVAAILVLMYVLGIITVSIWRSKSPGALSFQEITVPAGSKTQLTLPDGTQVWLNSQSKLTYANSYNQKSREVTLTGEGYFKVAEDKGKPFIVHTSGISVRALGTEFNVKCYPEEGSIETTLVKGLVQIEGAADQESHKKEGVILKPNDHLTFIKKTGKLYLSLDSVKEQPSKAGSPDKLPVKEEIRKERIIVQTLDPLPYVAWREDKLVLTGEKLEEIKPKLERWYGVSIHIDDSEILNYRFKGSFEKETLEQALEALKLASHFSYSIRKNQVTISK